MLQHQLTLMVPSWGTIGPARSTTFRSRFVFVSSTCRHVLVQADETSCTVYLVPHVCHFLFVIVQAHLNSRKSLVSSIISRIERNAAQAELTLLAYDEHAASISRALAETSAMLNAALSRDVLFETELLGRIRAQCERLSEVCWANPRQRAIICAIARISKAVDDFETIW